MTSAVPPIQPGANTLPAAAQPRFVPIGPTHMTSGDVPNSGKVNAVALDPTNPNIIYTASGRGTGLETYSSAGIFRTRDGGNSWEAIVDGLTDRTGLVSSVVNALWIDAQHPTVLLAGTEYDGIFRSTDSGSSWHNVLRTTQATEFASFGGSVYAATAAGIVASSDDGGSWSVEVAGTTQRYPRALAEVSNARGSVMLAGMSDGTIYSFGSGTWMQIGKLPYNLHTGTDGSSPAVHQIAIDPFAPTTIYASQNDGRWDQNLSASTDGGHSWHYVTPHYKQYTYYNIGLGTQAIAFSQVHPHTLYIGLDGAFTSIQATGQSKPRITGERTLQIIDDRNIWPIADGKGERCWIASDQGLDVVPACTIPLRNHGDDVVSKTMNTGLARRFLISPDGRTIVASLQDFDSHGTFDGGASWSELFHYSAPQFALYEDGFNELAPGNPKICYAFDEASGLLVSNDGCHTYASPSTMAKSIFPSRLMTTPLAFDPQNPNTLYAVSGDIVGAGFARAPRAVFKTTDGGVTLTKLHWPLNEPGMISIDPHNGAHIVVGDLADQKASSMLVTFDRGKHWTKSAGVPVTAFWYSATVSPTNGKIVLATSVDASNNVFVLRSTDGGRSFRQTAVVTNAPLVRGPVDHDLAERLQLPPPAFVYSPARQVLFNQDATRGAPLAALTTLNGAYVSNDLGRTWRRLDRALIAHSFWGIRWNRGYLYLGSDGQGIVKSTQPLQ